MTKDVKRALKEIESIMVRRAKGTDTAHDLSTLPFAERDLRVALAVQAGKKRHFWNVTFPCFLTAGGLYGFFILILNWIY